MRAECTSRLFLFIQPIRSLLSLASVVLASAIFIASLIYLEKRYLAMFIKTSFAHRVEYISSRIRSAWYKYLGERLSE